MGVSRGEPEIDGSFERTQHLWTRENDGISLRVLAERKGEDSHEDRFRWAGEYGHGHYRRPAARGHNVQRRRRRRDGDHRCQHHRLGQDRGHATEARRAIRHRRHCQQPRSCRSGRCAGARRKAPVLPRSDRRNSRGRKREHTGYLYRRWSHTSSASRPFSIAMLPPCGSSAACRTPRPS